MADLLRKGLAAAPVGSATLVRADKTILNRRKALTRKFVSGESGVELAGFDAASEADRKSALRR